MPQAKGKKRPTTTQCGVAVKVVDKYGICDIACTPAKKRKCGYHKKKVNKK